MNIHPTSLRLFALTLVASATLAACSSMPPNNSALDQARSDLRRAQSNPPVRDLAGGQLKQAEDAFAKANDAWARGEKTSEVDHLAYLAKQRVAIAEETGKQKAAELAITGAEADRDKVRLAARTSEADAAKNSANAAQLQSEAALRQSQESQRQAEAARRLAELATERAAASQMAATDAQLRNSQLEAQMQEMNAKKTERGMVITIGDVLFDTDKAQLKSGGARNVDKLVGFLKQYPQRKVLIEGFTDSTGGTAHNQDLSTRRADAVRGALVDMGISSERVAAAGYGEAYPVSENDSAAGRQLNRRVEIILSDDNGNIMKR